MLRRPHLVSVYKILGGRVVKPSRFGRRLFAACVSRKSQHGPGQPPDEKSDQNSGDKPLHVHTDCSYVNTLAKGAISESTRPTTAMTPNNPLRWRTSAARASVASITLR